MRCENFVTLGIKESIMGIKVKCQHCWKIFEAPDDSINRQRQCLFCQRMTLVKPLDVEEKQEEEKKTVVRENEDSQNLFHLSLIVLLVLTLANFLFLFRSLKADEIVREIMLEKLEMEANLQKSVEGIRQGMEGSVDRIEQTRKQFISPENIAILLVRSLEGSIKLFTEELAHIESNLENGKKETNKLKFEIENMKKLQDN